MISLASTPTCNAMSLAFTMSAPDSDSYFFADANAELFCMECGSFIGPEYVPSRQSVRSGFRDFGYTYDGRLLVSQRAKDFLLGHATTELSFLLVKSQKELLYVLHVRNEIAFDSDARRTCFVNKCHKCGRYESVVGATPAFLRGAADINKLGIYRTDLEFGSGREKSPLLIVGSELKRLLAREFEELEFREVHATGH